MEKQVIQSVGFRNIKENGEITGFQFKIRLPYYRGVYLSQLMPGTLYVDGEKFEKDQIIWVLKGEEYTLDEIAELAPESLTVHSLAIKRAAHLNERFEEFENDINHDTDKMLSLVAARTKKAGLEPYYLYRQKNIAGNLENVGYSKPGLECIYNILIMEESLDTFAAGAGAITRLLTTENGKVTRVDRVENCKNVDEYIYASLSQPPIKIIDKNGSNDDLDFTVECPNCGNHVNYGNEIFMISGHIYCSNENCRKNAMEKYSK